MKTIEVKDIGLATTLITNKFPLAPCFMIGQLGTTSSGFGTVVTFHFKATDKTRTFIRRYHANKKILTDLVLRQNIDDALELTRSEVRRIRKQVRQRLGKIKL